MKMLNPLNWSFRGVVWMGTFLFCLIVWAVLLEYTMPTIKVIFNAIKQFIG